MSEKVVIVAAGRTAIGNFSGAPCAPKIPTRHETERLGTVGFHEPSTSILELNIEPQQMQRPEAAIFNSISIKNDKLTWL